MSPRLTRRKSELASPARFAAFYAGNADRLLAFFVRSVFEHEAALDLTAETFAQAYLSRARFRGSGDGEATAWLYGIARHQLSRYHRRGAAENRALRRLGIEVPRLDAADFERIEELAGTAGLRAAARNGMKGLSESERAAVLLRVVEELPYPEVASRLGISEVAARARTSRGLRSLADALDDQRQEKAGR